MQDIREAKRGWQRGEAETEDTVGSVPVLGCVCTQAEWRQAMPWGIEKRPILCLTSQAHRERTMEKLKLEENFKPSKAMK